MKLKCKIVDILSAAPMAGMDPRDCEALIVKENDRIRIGGPKGETVASIICSDKFSDAGTLFIPESVARAIGAKEGDELDVVYSQPPESVRAIRRKMDGQKLGAEEITAIVKDISEGSLTNIEVASWLTSLQINGMDLDETADFARAMVDTGDKVVFDKGPIFDFHSMGGVPGNKITPIVVSIAAAAGLIVPKTSSRAISSACGTSDFVETFCDINVTLERLKELGETVGGAFVWGGSMNLAPVDDIVIKIERPLGINPRAKMLASIISKKLAIGANYLLIDIPTGAGTKVHTIEEARAYAQDFMGLGARLGIHVECAITYADQPVGSAIGPILEARECIRILEGETQPTSVVEKACECAGILLEMAGFENGREMAHELLRSGKAHKKFLEIVTAQGGRPDLKSTDLVPGKYTADVVSSRSGYVNSIRNRDLVAVAKACGASMDKGAGLLLCKTKGQRVEEGEVLFTLYAESETKLKHAQELAERYCPVQIEGMLLKRVTAQESD